MQINPPFLPSWYDRTDAVRHDRQIKGFGNYLHACIQRAVIKHSIFSVAGDKENFEIWPYLASSVSNLPTIHTIWQTNAPTKGDRPQRICVPTAKLLNQQRSRN